MKRTILSNQSKRRSSLYNSRLIHTFPKSNHLKRHYPSPIKKPLPSYPKFILQKKILGFIFFLSFIFYLFPIFNSPQENNQSTPITNPFKTETFITSNHSLTVEKKGKVELFDSPNTFISTDNILELSEGNYLSSNNPYSTPNFSQKNIQDLIKKPSIYRVIKGDTLWKISLEHKITIDSIISLNQIDPLKPLTLNQPIKIPKVSGLYITVKKNDTLLSISQKYKTSQQKIIDINQLKSTQHLPIHSQIFIPNGKYSFKERQELFQDYFSTPLKKKGILTSPYGIRLHPIYKRHLFHQGIDIAMNVNTPVFPARNGVVSFSGIQGNYGNLVIIKHNGGFLTYYAHLNKLLVKKGDIVSNGKPIGLLGSTGASTGPHLHFEVRQNGKILNPLNFIRL